MAAGNLTPSSALNRLASFLSSFLVLEFQRLRFRIVG